MQFSGSQGTVDVLEKQSPRIALRSWGSEKGAKEASTLEEPNASGYVGSF